MTLDLVVKDAVREVVREEIRAALKELGGFGLGVDAPLSYRQAADFVGCHVNTVADWVKRGLLPSSGRGKLTRVKRSDLLLVLEKLAAPVTTETPAEIAARILNTIPRGSKR
jgi:excisionase family DNA binding protein